MTLFAVASRTIAAFDEKNTRVHIDPYGETVPSRRDPFQGHGGHAPAGLQRHQRAGHCSRRSRSSRSFTNHFASKEAFALEVVDLYYARSCKMMRETLGNEALSPLGRIRAYIEAYRVSCVSTAASMVACVATSLPRRATKANRCASARRRYSRIYSAASLIA